MSAGAQLVKPRALRPGDTIGIIAPASAIKEPDLRAGCEALRRAGYNPFYFDSILDQDLYFAGSADRRACELEEMFDRDEVRAILCARGGYGCNYLLPEIDVQKISAHPKIFIGYSDVTSLLTYLLDSAGLAVFHGPMAAKDWSHPDGVDLVSWSEALTSITPWSIPFNSSATGLLDGDATARLYGGCLSILVASLGTPYEIKPSNTILFLEDIAAKPYQIDRMLMQLKLGGFLESVHGIVFGEMLNCVQSPDQPYTLPQVVIRILGDLGIPVAYGVRSGHVSSGNITLPFGVQAKLSVKGESAHLQILESAVRL